ncbi:hypothetical protein ROS9278_01584 [Roseomonas sp. CECT 9278]|nr:hypothetical protein ROS9278_01584 [Roseomonas sp. CECT 9278]
MADRLERLYGLVDLVYGAALDESEWAGAAARIADAFGTHSAGLQIVGGDDGSTDILSTTANLTVQAVEAYRAHYVSTDVWIRRASSLKPGTGVLGQELISDADLIRSEFWQDWARHQRQFHVLGGLMPVSEDQTLVLAVHADRFWRGFDEDDRQLFGAFLPHLQRALKIRRKGLLEGERAAGLSDAIDRFRTAVWVVGRHGRILAMNGAAQDVLELPASPLVMRNSVLATRRGETTNRLLAAISAAWAEDRSDRMRQPHPPIRLEFLDASGCLHVVVAPSRQDGGRHALVFASQPRLQRTDAAMLKALFGLSTAEADIVARLVAGDSIREIAQSRRASVQTVRSQVKTVLSKTNTRTQAQLVGLIMGSLANLRSA